MKIRAILILVVVVVATFASCKKTDDYDNPVFMCECGGFSWQGSPHNLLMSEYVQLADDLPLTRRYYATADIALEDEFYTHNLNYQIEIDTVTNSIFFIEADNIPFLVEEINNNDDLLPYRRFVAVDGIVTVAPSILGGTETVAFDVILKEEFNGQLVGFDIPFSGTMSVQISL